jgi:hypothetical protein
VKRNAGATSGGARRLLLAGAALSVLAVTAGCSHKEAAGQVRGSLGVVSVGSPVGAAPQPLSGEIVLTDDTGRATKVTAGTDGNYAVSLPAGIYRARVDSVSSGIPTTACRTQIDSYTVLPGGRTRIDFVCGP